MFKTREFSNKDLFWLNALRLHDDISLERLLS